MPALAQELAEKLVRDLRKTCPGAALHIVWAADRWLAFIRYRDGSMVGGVGPTSYPALAELYRRHTEKQRGDES